MDFSAQQLSEDQVQSLVEPQTKQKSPRKPMNKKKLLFGGGIVLLLAVVVLQVIIVILMLNPGLIISNNNQSILDEVAQLTDINTSQTSTIAEVADADQLRDENAIQAQVYKDAQNGDYVIGFEDKMVIYRRSENKIIYEGQSPGQILRTTQQDLINTISELVVEKGLIASDSEEVPQVNVVAEVDAFKAQSAEFYVNLAVGDVIAVYNDAGVIVVYRPETGVIINSGRFGVSISPIAE